MHVSHPRVRKGWFEVSPLKTVRGRKEKEIGGEWREAERERETGREEGDGCIERGRRIKRKQGSQ